MVLLVTMAMSTLAFFALAVAVVDIQDEFGISRFEIGVLGAANTLIGGLLAPASGRFSDRVGGRRAVQITLITSGLTAVAIALSSNYLMLLVAMALAGIPQGMANPAANKAIATGIAEHARGAITGVKQSGVQFAVFLTGISVPWLSANFGWRTAIWLCAALSFAMLALTPLVKTLGDTTPPDAPERDEPSDAGPSEQREGAANRLPTFVTQVAWYGFFLGAVGGGFGRFLQLFAEEEIGLTAGRAGLVFAAQGLVAIPVRLASGVLLDRGVSVRLTLTLMGFGGAASMVLVFASISGGEAFLWAGTILSGVTIGAWNTAANLSMIRLGADAGRASGRLILGFMVGLTVGGPAVGWTVDRFSYSPAWLGCAAFSLVGGLVVMGRRRAVPSLRTDKEAIS